jgi:hypothetical protein
MLVTLAGAAVVATLLGQIIGYVGRTRPALNKAMFACWGVSAFCAIALFYLNRQDTITFKQDIAMRDITPREMQEASSKLMKFSGQHAQINVYPVNFEGVWIADKVYGILLDAHWDVQFPERLPAPPGKGLMVQGIFIDCSNDNASKDAAIELRSALSSIVGMSQAPCTADNFDSGAFDRSKPIVWVLVGDKPAPLRSWVTQ